MAINAFMKICGPDINGGSSSKGHETEIEVISWNHGFNQPTSAVRSHGGSGTVEKANHQPFVFTKTLDSATDDLLKGCWSGTHHDSATLTCYRSSGDTGGNQIGVAYLKVEMESVIVSDFQISGSVGDIPMETVALTYAKVTYTYTQSDKTKGTVGAAQPVSHDLRTHVVA
jgi:type VI secretion system secreted protein Hcp